MVSRLTSPGSRCDMAGGVVVPVGVLAAIWNGGNFAIAVGVNWYPCKADSFEVLGSNKMLHKHHTISITWQLASMGQTAFQ